MTAHRHPTAAFRAALASGAWIFAACLAGSALAQQYQNFEIAPDGRGGAQGTIGGRNFEVPRSYDRPPAGRVSPDTRRDRRTSVPQQTCIVYAEGRTRCN
ncbi:hypothetical protein [Agrobacterium pusense]|uniref:hypothetical protein n=1 Tax=Agrobacterium pusense TaxID=648995 RepID=UPI003FD6BEF6